MPSKRLVNPFEGLDLEGIHQAIVPIFNEEQLVQLILSKTPKVIEFVGQKGRGKTTHLRWLHSKFPQYPIFDLGNKDWYPTLMETNTSILFLDSIHHLTIFQRNSLFRLPKTIILTTHWSKKLEFLVARKKYYSIPFKGITPKLLQKIISKRLEHISNSQDLNSQFNYDINELIETFGDDYRGIINHLYDQYQQLILTYE